MSDEKTARQIRDEIDKERAKALKKIPSHHLTKLTGLREPSEYVVCTDGTEIAYNRAEEERFLSRLSAESEGKRKSTDSKIS